jgi:hypothetical protein
MKLKNVKFLQYTAATEKESKTSNIVFEFESGKSFELWLDTTMTLAQVLTRLSQLSLDIVSLFEQ